MTRRTFLILVCFCQCVSYTLAQNPFQAHIRPTDPLSPEEQKKTFKLPEGFSISLVASEPEIVKPLNLAFDHKGRLWATMSDAYPYQIEKGQFGKYSDSLKIFEDHNGDGSADVIHTFADNLNIPIGFYPYKNGAIVWSIPNILWLEDTDGDNKADVRKVLYGSFGQVIDTHGMQNAFRRGFDGWLYINHGFNNTSQIKGSDGSEIRLHSGNTYRVSVDGKTVQQYTWGQVNPFGSDFDKFGFLYTADCHTLPIYQLMKGAYYPSFGKPHDGLGFAPKVMQHLHGSTAISGLVLVEDPIWPKEFQNNIFVGNVMTSRINRDVMHHQGSSPKANEAEDFLKTSDPWFRPVDLRWGPDGAMYVADFYNKIIGHYEVSLKHPERDRKRGRIWRISYNGNDDSQRWNYPPLKLSHNNLQSAVKELSSDNKTRRNLALNFLIDNHPNKAKTEFDKILSGQYDSIQCRPLALWGAERLQTLSDARLISALVDPQENVRVQAFSICAERPKISSLLSRSFLLGLNDPSPTVQRVVVRTLASHPEPEYLKHILDLKTRVNPNDDHLIHRMNLALRDITRSLDSYQILHYVFKDVRYRESIQQTLLSINSSRAAGFLADNIPSLSPEVRESDTLLKHLSKNLPVADFGKLVSLIPSATRNPLTNSLGKMKVFSTETKARGLSYSDFPNPIKKRLAELSTTNLEKLNGLPGQSFRFIRDYSNPNPNIPWFVQSRSSSDGANGEKFLSSLPAGGESFTGTLRSQKFEIPAKLSFYVAGHAGYPETKAHQKNYIQLVDAETGVVLKKSFPPRNDKAQPYTWALEEVAGKLGYIEIHDGDTAGAYAWLAAGRFSVPELDVNEMGPRQLLSQITQVIDAVENIDSPSNNQLIEKLFRRSDLPSQARLVLANVLAKSQPDSFWALINEERENILLTSPVFFREFMEWASSRTNQDALNLVDKAFSIMEFEWQKRCANTLAKSTKGSQLLAGLIEKGKASQFLLKEDQLWQATMPHFSAQDKANFTKFRKQLENSQTSSVISPRELAESISNLSPDLDNGMQLFNLHCSICHKFKQVGQLVGPQLDGIANRGQMRLIEDIINPSLNLDVAFQARMIELDSGELLTGLFKNTNGRQRVFVDVQGKEFSVDSESIVEESVLSQSLMPPSFSQILTKQEMANLVGFLMAD